MNNDIYELLEIEEPSLFSVDQLGTANPIKHVIVRTGILLGVLAIIFIYSELKDFNGYDALIPIFFALFALVVWILFLGIEALILNSKRKYTLRNTNLITLGIVILLSIAVIVSFL